MNTKSTRAGRYVRQREGYRAFIPNSLPPTPPVQMDAELIGLLSRADLALGRLDGAASVLPNPNLFVAMYVRQATATAMKILDLRERSRKKMGHDSKGLKLLAHLFEHPFRPVS